jgi:hypothetical protein
MLISIINDKNRDYVSIIQQIMDRLTFYISPELFQTEQEIKKTGGVAGERKNIDFERHRRSAQETGVPELSPGMQNAINKIYKEKNSSGKVLRLMGDDGFPVGIEAVQQDQDDDDPGILGD